jgi:carboxypeptidase Taq
MYMESQTTHLRELLQEIAHLNAAIALLNWDQEVFMSPGSAQARANTLASLSARHHELVIATVLQNEVTRLEGLPDGALDARETALVREIAHDLRLAVKLPTEFVARITEATSRGQMVWQAARAANDFNQFAPVLEEIIALNREKAEYLGFTNSPYDALLDTFETGLTSSEVTKVFTPLKERLIPLLKQIAARTTAKRSDLEGNFSKESQLQLSRDVATAMGYSFDHGRLDLSTHPFSTSFHPTDARITTRVDEQDFWVCLGASMHETGHALYEQGLPAADFGSPLGEAASTGIHESQSRSWENIIGRSKPFWEHWYPELQRRYPEPFAHINLDQFLPALNEVRPSFIRVEADEVSYNLHIILRAELERDLIEGTLNVADLPKAWNAKFKEFFGLDVPSDALGVLQDVHWSCGYFGYFPTYALGNLYSAQLWAAVRRDIPTIDTSIAKADYAPFLGWMREHIHRYGRQYRPAELLTRATGESLNPEYFTAYLQERYGMSASTE